MMFNQCNEIESINLSSFDTSNVVDMCYLFTNCHKLKEIKGIDKFNTKNVTNMRGMFQLCNELLYLDLSNFNTDNVTDISRMFFGCNKLQYLNVSNFIINCETKNMLKFNKKDCKFIANDKKLINKFFYK